MEQKQKVSTKQLLIGIIIGLFVGTTFGAIVKIFNLDIDSSIVLIIIVAITFGSFYLYLTLSKKKYRNN